MKSAFWVQLQFAVKFLALLGIVAYCLAGGLTESGTDWYFVAVIFGLEVAATLLPFAVSYAGSRTEYTPDAMVIVAAAQLLPTRLATLAVPIGYLVGLIFQQGARRMLSSLLDQVSANAVAAFLAFSAGHLVGPPGSGLSSIVGAVVAAIVYETVGQLYVAVWASLVKQVDVKSFFVRGVLTSAVSWPWLVCLGILLGILAWDKPAALPLMAAPLVLIFVASRARIVATEDQARLDALLRATTEILAAPTVDEVTEAATSFAASVLERFGGRISSEGPQKGELGAKIPSARFADQYLVINALDGLTATHTRFDSQVLEVLASITATALDRAAMHDDVTQQAMRDPLTGLSNRRAFEEQVRVALTDRRGNETSGIIFLDLDGFKQINDSHGHEAGDRVLIETANRLRQAVRGGDLIGRLGGDEFTVLLRVHGEDDAILVAERVLTIMRQPIEVNPGVMAKVTPSLGIALDEGVQTDPAALLSSADAAMYEAKRSGKDRWFMAGRPSYAEGAPLAVGELSERADL
jgi:diguanylate cyclase (GGDEF)-like protein